MFINTNMLMESHKARETEMIHRAESSRIQAPAGGGRPPLGKRLMHTIANALVFLGLR